MHPLRAALIRIEFGERVDASGERASELPDAEEERFKQFEHF